MKHSALASLLLATLAACPSMDNAHFTSASDQQLARTFAASSGADVRSAATVGMLISGRNDTTKCPRIETHGSVTTASGPCSLDKGTWNGTVTAENVPSSGSTQNPAFDPTKPGTVRFDSVRITDTSGNGGTLDGFVTVDAKARTIDSDFTVDDNDISTNTVLHQTCDQSELCTASNSSIDISGLGEAKIEGAWRVETPASGALTVRGAQTLVFDLAATTPAKCVPFKIDGESRGQVCDSSDNAVAARESELDEIVRRVR